MKDPMDINKTMELPELEGLTDEELMKLAEEMAEMKEGTLEEGQFEEGVLDDDSEAEEDRKKMYKLEALGRRLQKISDDCVNKRMDVEARWVEDLRQYNGIYDAETQDRLKKAKGSRLFVNITRPKATMVESRLADMLFPTDEKNYGIKPTPVPELSAVEEEIANIAMRSPGQPMGMTPEGAPMMPEDVKAGIDDVWKQAEKKAQKMEDEIEDQLVEANYEVTARDVIHDAIIYGTGIIKGPFIVGRTRKKWTEQDGVQVLEIVEDITPDVERVDPFDFFPDMSATRIEDAEFVLQRHYLTRKQLKDLCKTPGFDEEKIYDLLDSDPSDPVASYREELRSLSGITGIEDNRYEVWEYHGSVRADDLRACGCEIDEAEAAELEAVVFFSQGCVLKATINPMDTEDRPFSVFNWEEDDSSIFGFGVPYLLRTPQKACNSAWRMVMDNAGLSSGPQIVVNTSVIRPVDGSWALSPRKVWELSDKGTDVRQAFGSFEVNSHLAELSQIFTASREMADELIALPQIAQGDAAPHLTQTAQGMSILMNAANSTMRRAVKNFDDDVTKPLIRRFYDWNMQFNDNDEIKGDFNIVARGSSALIEREGQSQRLMALLQTAGAFGPMIKMDAVARKLVQSMNLPAEELVMTKEEFEQMQQAQQQAQQQGGGQDGEAMKMQLEQQKLQLEMQKLQLSAQDSQRDYESDMASQQSAMARSQMDFQMAQARLQADMQKMAYERGLTVEQLRTQLGIKQMEIASDEKKLAAELEAKRIYGSGI